MGKWLMCFRMLGGMLRWLTPPHTPLVLYGSFLFLGEEGFIEPFSLNYDGLQTHLYNFIFAQKNVFKVEELLLSIVYEDISMKLKQEIRKEALKRKEGRN